MALKTNTTVSGTIVLLLGILFSSQAMSDEATPDCNASDRLVASSKPLVWPHVKQKATLTPSCWVDAMQVEAWRQERDLVQVDVRSSVKKRIRPLDDALDVALSSLLDKTFLRDSRVILIGDGFDQPELDRACLQMREAGFSETYALQDGVQAKLAESSGVSGKFGEITPAELLSGSRAIPWKLVAWDLSVDDIQKLPEKPAEQWFSAEGNLSLLAERIEQLSQVKRSQTAPVKIVIVTDNDKTNRGLQSLLQQHGVTADTLWLQGGMQAYQHYIQQQHDIRINTGLSLKRSCFGAATTIKAR